MGAPAVVASQLPKLSPKLVRALRSLYSTIFAGTRAVVSHDA